MNKFSSCALLKASRVIVGIFACGITAVLAAGCSSVAIKADFDEQAEFGAYTTFHIMQPQVPPSGIAAANPIALRRIERGIESAMLVKGLRGDSRRDADLLIAYHLGQHSRIDPAAWGYKYGARWRGNAAQHFGDGSLVVDLVDRKSMEIVWRGWATGVMGNGEQSQEKINEIVGTILDKYPPHK